MAPRADRHPRTPIRSGVRRALRVPRHLREVRLVRRLRAHGTAPAVTLSRPPQPYVRLLGLFAVTLLGAWLGLLIVGTVHPTVGPMDTTMSLRPSTSGGTRINISPLGALKLDSHQAPVRLQVDVDRLDPVRAEALVDEPERFRGLGEEVSADVEAAALDLGLRSAVAVVAGATALGLVVYRRPRRALSAGGLALVLLAASAGTAYATWNPRSVLEPNFTGLLTSAPSVVGSARSIVTDFETYQQELARLVTNLSKLYDTTSTLPAYQPDPSTTRVLRVSDIHLNPAAWSIVESLVKQYRIDVIVDSGDTMDHGTTPENGFLESIPGLGAPYVWVRGNHDSVATQRAMAELGDRVHVLDNGVPVNVAGLRIAGMGDPQFTPDRSEQAGGDPVERAAGRELAYRLRLAKAAGTPVDLAVTHDPEAAKETDGEVPLVLAGHTHRRDTKVLDKGTRLMVEGTTGGGGLRAVEDRKPQKVQASVLYLDERTARLQAWDTITLGGLGLSTAEVSRHLPGDLRPGSPPSTPSPPTDSLDTKGPSPGER